MSPRPPGPSKTDLRRGRFPVGSIGDITAAEEAMLLGEVPPEPDPPRPDDEPEKEVQRVV